VASTICLWSVCANCVLPWKNNPRRRSGHCRTLNVSMVCLPRKAYTTTSFCRRQSPAAMNYILLAHQLISHCASMESPWRRLRSRSSLGLTSVLPPLEGNIRSSFFDVEKIANFVKLSGDHTKRIEATCVAAPRRDSHSLIRGVTFPERLPRPKVPYHIEQASKGRIPDEMPFKEKLLMFRSPNRQKIHPKPGDCALETAQLSLLTDISGNSRKDSQTNQEPR